MMDMPTAPSELPVAVRREAPIVALFSPFQRFARTESLSGIALISAAVAALVWANSPWHEAYAALFASPVRVEVAGFSLEKDLLHWINDGLMAIFFLVVGLEIKREVIVGELATLRKAALPIAAAAGGMIVPVLIFAAINSGTEAGRGWGVPIATDIAFALGILALLGRRAPVGLKIFLTALAIVDDLGAVIVIAIFYTPSLAIDALGAAMAFLALLVIVNILGVHSRAPYVMLGVGLWFFILVSGIHPTIAGVLLAMTIPVRARIDAKHFVHDVKRALRSFESGGETGVDVPTTIEQRTAIHNIEIAAEHSLSPLHRLEVTLHRWSAFLILPIFALANAGVRVMDMDLGKALSSPITIGVAIGLIVGDQVGIFSASWLAVRSGIAELPHDITWRHIYGAACLAGVGFTMSLFIANLAFHGSPQLVDAKLGILLGSLVSGAWGYAVLRMAPVRAVGAKNVVGGS